MLISVVMTRTLDFHKRDIDMSRAFEIIKPKYILDVLQQAGCNDDELKLARTLLAGTKLRVRAINELSALFDTSIGYPRATASHKSF